MKLHEDEVLLQMVLEGEEAEESKRTLLYSSVLPFLCMAWGLENLYQPSMDSLGTTEGAYLGACAGGGRGHCEPCTERLLQGPVAPVEGGSLLCHCGRETVTSMP